MLLLCRLGSRGWGAWYGLVEQQTGARIGLSVYRCLAAGIRQRTTACERFYGCAAYCVPDLISHTPPPWRALLGRQRSVELGTYPQPTALWKTGASGSCWYDLHISCTFHSRRHLVARVAGNLVFLGQISAADAKSTINWKLGRLEPAGSGWRCWGRWQRARVGRKMPRRAGRLFTKAPADHDGARPFPGPFALLRLLSLGCCS